eukprot:TRINITY_DN1019_c0_g1_i2.p1 TRINITY_DN1019_c0_g1~~TRINITY_DN1019_c0_g1_i2.p1  ORF type:complete len:332 (+),score=76.30 TRINITY_DN1019_c0_g1_i2:41-997(+)
MHDTVLTLSDGFKMGMKRWSPTTPDAQKRILCYPGWLDNAGSFDEIAPLLCEAGFDVVALDPPGCGKSQWMPAYCNYNDFEEASMLMKMADMLGWGKVALMGHSRGGGVAFIAAASFPERVSAVVAIEAGGYGVAGVYAHEITRNPADVLRANYKSCLKNTNRKLRVFKTFEEAVQHTQHNKAFPKTKKTAENIVRRHVQQESNGSWVFTHDPRQYGHRQAVKLSHDMQMRMLSSVKSPCLSLVSPVDFFISLAGHATAHKQDVSRTARDERRKTIKTLTTKVLDPDSAHHVHSDDAPQVASIIIPYLNTALAPCSKL